MSGFIKLLESFIVIENHSNGLKVLFGFEHFQSIFGGKLLVSFGFWGNFGCSGCLFCRLFGKKRFFCCGLINQTSERTVVKNFCSNFK